MRLGFLVLFFAVSIPIYSQSCDSLQLVNRVVRASETDPNISWELAGHQVYYNPFCTANNSLLVYLVGSYDNPTSTVKFPALAANNGHHVIVLKYKNDVAAKTACASSSKINCFESFRQEIIYGTSVSDEVTVDSVNSIVNRLSKLIAFLSQNYSAENWGQFLSSNQVDWSKVIVAGHSQGGGHAAFLAKTQLVKKALFFASPNDYSTFYAKPAAWCSGSWLTPTSSLYGFNNLQDDVVPFAQQKEIWDSIGFSNSIDTVSVDKVLSPFQNAHFLYTNYDAQSGASDNHSSMIRDVQTPSINDGSPLYEPVWRYLLGIESVTNVKGVASRRTVQIAPNPFKTKTTITSDQPIVAFKLLNTAGKIVFSEYGIHDYSAIIKGGDLEQGCYFIRLELLDHSIVNLKVIKE